MGTEGGGDPRRRRRRPMVGQAEELASKAECDALFQQLDKNGDGQLTKSEIKKGLSQIQTATGLAKSAKQVWKDADADGSKAVDREEFFEFMGRQMREHADADAALKAELASFTSEPAQPLSPAKAVVNAAGKKDIRAVVAANRRRAARGDKIAQHKLGLRFLHGDGVGQDEAEGAAWLRKAADQGCTASLRLLEGLHIRKSVTGVGEGSGGSGGGSSVDQVRGHAELQRGLELVYSKSYPEAVLAFTAAKQALGPSDTTSSYNLACCYALQNQVGPACAWLGTAVAAGLSYEELMPDPDHTSIFADRRYEVALDAASVRQTADRDRARALKAAARRKARAGAEKAVVQVMTSPAATARSTAATAQLCVCSVLCAQSV